MSPARAPRSGARNCGWPEGGRAVKSLGRRGEDLAARYLESKGYRVVDRNYRLRLGELDLVAELDGLLVFCEVKTRTSAAYGQPFEAVTAEKQRRLKRLAQAYLQDHLPLRNREVRFDVMSVRILAGGPQVEHIPNAF